MKGEYKIEIKDNVVTFAVSTRRTTQLLLKAKVKDKLDNMLRKAVVVPVEHVTDLCAPMVVCTKKSKKSIFSAKIMIFFCIDYKKCWKFVYLNST